MVALGREIHTHVPNPGVVWVATIFYVRDGWEKLKLLQMILRTCR